MVCVRRWGWRGAGIAAGVAVAGGLGAAGQWWGGLAGAAVIAAGGFVAPEVSDWLKDRRSRSAVLDEVSVPVVLPGPHRPGGGDAFWLRPEQRVVGFIGRPELAVLRRWCAGPGGPGLMLMTGAGGVGKTRLALRLAEELDGQGWLCRMVRAGGEPGAVAAALAAHRGGVLLVVDYAETRPGVADLLRDAARDAGGRLRVLLVARGEGEWWARLKGSPDDGVRALVAEAGVTRVGALAGGVAGAELVRAAVPEFARVVGVAVPEVAGVSIPDEAVPVLVLHAAALLAVLDARDRPGAGQARVVADEDVLARLLGRETAFWLASAAAAGVSGAGGADSVTAGQAVAVACLFAAADEGEAARLLRRVPGLADAPAGTVLRVARWLRHVYPPSRPQPGPYAEDGHWWGTLQPDLLAERHVADEFAGSPDFAGACLRELSAAQAAGALTVLARACAHRPQAPAMIAAALRADLPGLGVPAVDVAVQTPGPVGGILADVAGTCDATLETLVRIEEAIPYPTITLARADLALTARISSMLPADTGKADLARWRDLLGVRLSQVGRPAEALPATQEAVEIRRELAAASPDRYRADLAASLSNLGVLFSEVGRPAEALPATQEAVEIRRELAAASPDRYRPDLARSLSNLGVRLAEVGRPAEALPATQEAVTVYRELAAASPDRYRPDLAASLDNLGIWLSQVGRPAEALPATQEAVEIRRELAAASPDRYRPDLARSLSNLGVRLSQVGRPAEALPATQEAVTVYRELAAASPDRYRPDLARSLDNLGIWLSQVGRPAEALPATQEAVTVYRELAAASPDRYRPDLARSLDNLGVRLSQVGRPAEALPATQEAVTVYRELAAASPDRYRPDLARSLSNLGIWLSQVGRPAEALPATQEAVTVYRELAAASPDRYRPDLAASLDNLGVRLSQVGRPAEAETARREALAIKALAPNK